MQRKKWSIFRTAVYGLVIQIVVMWWSDWYWGTDEWAKVTFYLESGFADGVVFAISALLPGPLLFAALTCVRNAIYEIPAKKSTGRLQKTSDTSHGRTTRLAHRIPAPLFVLALAVPIYLLAPSGSKIEQMLLPQSSAQALTSATPMAIYPNSPSANAPTHRL